MLGRIEKLQLHPAASGNPGYRRCTTYTKQQNPPLKPSEYLLRHEILRLHVADTRTGAQFYPPYRQIKVSSSSTKDLLSGVWLPARTYDPDNGGIIVQLASEPGLKMLHGA